MEAGVVELKWLTLVTDMATDMVTDTLTDLVTDTLTDLVTDTLTDLLTFMGVSDVMTTEMSTFTTTMELSPLTWMVL
jgi:hypothetical protein